MMLVHLPVVLKKDAMHESRVEVASIHCSGGENSLKRKVWNRVAGAVTRPGSHTTRHAYYAPRRFPAASPSSCHLSVKLIRPISLNQAIFMAICD